MTTASSTVNSNQPLFEKVRYSLVPQGMLDPVDILLALQMQIKKTLRLAEDGQPSLKIRSNGRRFRL